MLQKYHLILASLVYTALELDYELSQIGTTVEELIHQRVHRFTSLRCCHVSEKMPT